MGEDGHKYHFGQNPEMPWRKKMKYRDKLKEQLTDDKFLVLELVGIWIAAMLTILVIFSILYYVGQ